MKGSLDVKLFPPGVRFQPTNEELIMYYLKRKVLGKSLSRPQMISELDVYKFEPWDLPEMACLKTKDRYWYFFCPRSKKYPSGGRVNRTAKNGYWKSTGEDKEVKYKERCVGKIKHLVFHSGKSPNGARTNWVMHEYVLNDTLLADKGVPQDSYVICKLFEKSGAGPKNGEDYGARFVEEEWDSDSDENVQERTSGFVSCDMCCPCGCVSSPFTSVAAPDVHYPSTSAVMGTPHIAATTSNTTTAVMGVPYLAATTSSTTTSMGTPYISATTPLDVPIAAPLSLDVPIAAPLSLNVSEEDEVERLLQHFTDDPEDFKDIFVGLEDLNNSFIEINDLVNSYEKLK